MVKFVTSKKKLRVLDGKYYDIKINKSASPPMIAVFFVTDSMTQFSALSRPAFAS